MKIISTSILAGSLIFAFLLGYFFPTKTNHEKAAAIHLNSQPSRVFNDNSELPNFSTYKDIKLKKSDFFAYMLPRVKKANQIILQERLWVENLLSQGHDFNKTKMQKLLTLSEKYKVKTLNPNKMISELLSRVDSIPASLVLAQAANESAWGTSRFAKQGNNLFGQWCYVKGCGIIPKDRDNSQRHEVASFENIQQSITSYMHNLNSQISYGDLRELRKDMRQNTQTISGIKLANGLLKYSTRRMAYVEEIQTMIRQNNLAQYD